MNFKRLCGDHAFHVQLIEAAELGTDLATGLLYHDNVVSAKLRDLLTGDPSKINLDMDWWVFFFFGEIPCSELLRLVKFIILFCPRLLEQALQMNYLENITRLIPTVEAMLRVNTSADASEQPGISLSAS